MAGSDFHCRAASLSPSGSTSTTSIELVDGGCELTITTQTTQEWADQTVDGWKMILVSLAEALP